MGRQASLGPSRQQPKKHVFSIVLKNSVKSTPNQKCKICVKVQNAIVKCTGLAKADKALDVMETSHVVIETVEKVCTVQEVDTGPHMPVFHSDASKVSSKGLGLKKAHPGRQNNFTINASQADMWNNMLETFSYGIKLTCGVKQHILSEKTQLFHKLSAVSKLPVGSCQLEVAN
ncbi:hypothetical protein FHG87_023332 [Trinorchestia longiramus]|nr:hypothetical protein FHG87_023332 [Trinorchestia longiramus]